MGILRMFKDVRERIFRAFKDVGKWGYLRMLRGRFGRRPENPNALRPGENPDPA